MAAPSIWRRGFPLGCLVIALMLSASCAAPLSVPPESISTSPGAVQAPPLMSRETGTAGWYGKELQGKKNARGELFDMSVLSAAHRTLPLGTSLRVTNLANNRSLTAVVSHRGPLVRERLLDLSHGAARELGFLEHGVTGVLIEHTVQESDTGLYTLHGALYREKENALLLKDRLQGSYGNVSVYPYETNFGTFFQVTAGVYRSREKAEAAAPKLALEGLEPVVIRKDR